ncbi:MAG: hypothetical protein NVS4B9_35470 [Ktedonobacteraceae bacterium]
MDLSKLFGDGNFWVSFVSLVITVGSSVFGIWSYFRSRERRLITYEFEDRDTNVVSVDRDQGENIKIFMDDMQVQEVRYQLIQIRNEGNVAVDVDDYRKPLQIAFSPREETNDSDPSQFVLRAGIPEASPSLGISSHNARDYIILDADQQYVSLKDVLLNAGDWIRIKVLTLGKADITVTGQIRNGEIKPYVPTSNLFTRRNVLFYILLGALLFFLLYQTIGLITSFSQGRCAIGSIQVKGSSVFYDTANGYASSYRAICPIGFVNVSEDNSSNGLNDLKAGKIQIADSEKPAQAEGLNTADFVDNQVAVIVFNVIVNRGVTNVNSLTIGDLQQIYSGRVKNWSELMDVKGPDLPIKVFGRSSTSGTYAAFTNYVLGSELNSAPTYHEEGKTSYMADAVASTPGAIGYVDVDTATRRIAQLTPITIGGIQSSNRYVRDNTYPFWAIEHMYTRISPDPLTKSFVSYVTNNIQTSDALIKLSDMSQDALDKHK